MNMDTPVPPDTPMPPATNASPPGGRKLTRSQQMGVWGGVAGSVIGCTAWLIAMAALSGDWLTVGITLALDVAVVFLFGRLCLRHARSRLLLLAAVVAILTTHCLAMYWWRLDLWRADLNMDAAELASQKKVVTFTVSAMVAILLVQLLLMHYMQNKSRNKQRV